MKYLIVASLVFVSTTVFAGGVAIPNTFQSGQAAVAAEVNENFTAVADGVNANAAAIVNAAKSLRVVDGSNADIGAFIAIDQSSLTLFTDEGYLRSYIEKATGGSVSYGDRFLMYLSPGCTGQVYADTPNGTVYNGVDNQLKYVPRDGQAVSTVSVSYLNGGWGSPPAPITCVEGSHIGGTPSYMWAAYPNDPAVTGVPNTDYVTPLNTVLK